MPDSLLIFDLDGTLIDSSESICLAVNQARESLGHQAADGAFLNKRIGLPANALFEDLQLDSTQLVNIVEKFRENLSTAIDEGTKFFPGVLDFLHAAKSRALFTAIATNKPSFLAKQLVSNCELRDLVDLTVGIGEFLPKPNPSMLMHCSRHFKVSNTTMFGDRVEDMQAAVMANAQAFGVIQGFHTESDLFDSGANHVFPNFVSVHKYFDINVWGN